MTKVSFSKFVLQTSFAKLANHAVWMFLLQTASGSLGFGSVAGEDCVSSTGTRLCFFIWVIWDKVIPTIPLFSTLLKAKPPKEFVKV